MKKLRCLFVVALLLAVNATDAQFSWSLQHGPGTNLIKDLTFVDANNGWAVGKNGLILVTHNGGLTWSSLTPPANMNFMDVHFISTQKGWIIAQPGVIFKTINGGNTWSSPYTISMNDAQGIFFVNDTLGWACGSDGTTSKMFYTDNGGVNWSPQIVTASGGLWKMDFVNTQKGWAVGTSGVVNTFNGGISWSIQVNPSGEALEDICMVNDQQGWAVGQNGAIIHTEDGGVTWVVQPTGTSYSLLDVDFIDEENGLVVGVDGQIIYTTNGGDSWTIISEFVGLGIDFDALDMHDVYTAHVGGSYEKIYKSPLPENDLSVIEYHGLDTVCADVPIQVILTIYNEGPGPIHDANFVISAGSTPVLIYHWTGNLAAGSYQDIDLGQITVNSSGNFSCIISGDSITTNNISNKFIYVHPYDGGVSGPHHICQGAEVTINAFGGNSYYWYNATVDSTAKDQTVQPNQNINYKVEIESDYCTTIEEVEVFVAACDAMITAISPNDDGVNDKLIIEEIVGYENSVVIYNRWGDVIVSFTNYDNVNVVWEGRDENGKNMVESTYYYTYEAYEIGVSKSSWVQIVR